MPGKSDPKAHNLHASLYDVRAICKKTGRGQTYIRKEIREGRLKTFFQGNRRVAKAADLAAWLDAQEAAGMGQATDNISAHNATRGSER
jgi:hypothetical protein